ncbi:MAG TPA: hemerythrin domain-containing protein [Nitrospira sp.]|nr:hemerythrin domain-containing protein [Nitrospira sp.]
MAKRTPKQSQHESQTPQPADAVQILKADHRQIRKLFDQFRAAAAEDKAPLAARLFVLLDVHGRVEEELVYAAVRAGMETADSVQANGASDRDDEGDDGEMAPLDGVELDLPEEDDESDELVAAAYESHQIVRDLIQQLRSIEPHRDDFRELFDELEEIVTEHVAEEESEILPLLADGFDIHALGAELQRRKDELTSRSSLAA